MIEVVKNYGDPHGEKITHCMKGLMEIKELEKASDINISALEKDLRQNIQQEIHQIRMESQMG